LHRLDRQGFKAGALSAGLGVSRAEFVAIFDADFVPEPDFLKRALPYFQRRKKDGAPIGMVQATWGYLNREQSSLTQAQGVLLDGHFCVESPARFASQLFFNFNGTAGIWRRQCIEDAGGWHSDTLTEDLDLSYRAQLKGWRFVFLDHLRCDSELPHSLSALRTQQYRWVKGSIETAKKLLPRLFESNVSFRILMEGGIHLTNNVGYALVLLLALFYPATLALPFRDLSAVGILFLLCPFLGVQCFLAYGQWQAVDSVKSWTKRLVYLPWALFLAVGLSFHNTRAILAALVGFSTPFERTPKHGQIMSEGREENAPNFFPRFPQFPMKLGKKPILKRRKTYWISLFGEGALMVYYLWALWGAFQYQIYSGIPFLVLFGSSFGYVFGLGLAEIWSTFWPNFRRSFWPSFFRQVWGIFPKKRLTRRIKLPS